MATNESRRFSRLTDNSKVSAAPADNDEYSSKSSDGGSEYSSDNSDDDYVRKLVRLFSIEYNCNAQSLLFKPKRAVKGNKKARTPKSEAALAAARKHAAKVNKLSIAYSIYTLIEASFNCQLNAMRYF